MGNEIGHIVDLQTRLHLVIVSLTNGQFHCHIYVVLIIVCREYIPSFSYRLLIIILRCRAFQMCINLLFSCCVTSCHEQKTIFKLVSKYPDLLWLSLGKGVNLIKVRVYALILNRIIFFSCKLSL